MEDKFFSKAEITESLGIPFKNLVLNSEDPEFKPENCVIDVYPGKLGLIIDCEDDEYELLILSLLHHGCRKQLLKIPLWKKILQRLISPP